MFLCEQSKFTYNDTNILLEEAIPCVLHLRNLTGEKILKVILLMRLIQCNGIVKKEKEFQTNVEFILNQQVWGTEKRASQWVLPINAAKGSQEGKTVGTICLPNYRVTSLIKEV